MDVAVNVLHVVVRRLSGEQPRPPCGACDATGREASVAAPTVELARAASLIGREYFPLGLRFVV
jgi:hypothetical protein